MAGYGLGAGGLAGLGLDQKGEATQAMGVAAQQEASRNIHNEQAEAERKAGNRQLASTVGGLAGAAIGAQYGSAAGPWGAAIGGVVGYLAGDLF